VPFNLETGAPKKWVPDFWMKGPKSRSRRAGRSNTQVSRAIGMAPLRAKTDRSPAWHQFVLPGAERATDATTAGRAGSAGQACVPQFALRTISLFSD
jgi:hypothetical protein